MIRWLLCACFPLAAFAAPPNVVFTMTDNHGAWTLGCYGNRDIRTPNIDALANNGVLFERAYANNPVCSPTRASYLTGLMPSQHGVHCFLLGGRLQVGPNARNTLTDFTSVPEILKKAGYRCGLVGKWHLGGNLKPQEGMDDYWITMPHGATSAFYDAQVIENGKQRREPRNLTDLWTERAVKFIEQNRRQPFFLFLSYNGPYGLGRTLLKPSRNRHVPFYANKKFPSFPRTKTHEWLFNNKDYLNNLVSIRRYAAELSGVDDGVGTVMTTLRQLDLADNTLVVFCGDQGWVGGHGGFWGMGDHARPFTGFDGMMHVPLIWHHPARIKSRRVKKGCVTNYDFFPTLMSYLGLESNYNDPGRDYSPMLAGKQTEWDDTVFYEFEYLRCIRTPEWKFIGRFPDGPHELYDLKSDPAESRNLFGERSTRKRRRNCWAARGFPGVGIPRSDLNQLRDRPAVGDDAPDIVGQISAQAQR